LTGINGSAPQFWGYYLRIFFFFLKKRQFIPIDKGGNIISDVPAFCVNSVSPCPVSIGLSTQQISSVLYPQEANTIEITTKPYTDLWQRTHYYFRNDTAPVLQMRTSEKYFLFILRVEFESKHRFDPCGIVMCLNSGNWLKGSIEYENDAFQYLGSIATNQKQWRC